MPVYSEDHRKDAVKTVHPIEERLSQFIERVAVDTSLARQPECLAPLICTTLSQGFWYRWSHVQ